MDPSNILVLNLGNNVPANLFNYVRQFLKF